MIVRDALKHHTNGDDLDVPCDADSSGSCVARMVGVGHQRRSDRHGLLRRHAHATRSPRIQESRVRKSNGPVPHLVHLVYVHLHLNRSNRAIEHTARDHFADQHLGISLDLENNPNNRGLS
jgi:hypothetical protein